MPQASVSPAPSLPDAELAACTGDDSAESPLLAIGRERQKIFHPGTDLRHRSGVDILGTRITACKIAHRQGGNQTPGTGEMRMINPRGTFRAGSEASGTKGNTSGALTGRPCSPSLTAVRASLRLDDGLHALTSNARLVGEPPLHEQRRRNSGRAILLHCSTFVPVAAGRCDSGINTGKLCNALTISTRSGPNAEATVGR